MTSRITWGSLSVLLLSALSGVSNAGAQGMSPSNPARVGVAVKSEIYCGDSAVSLEPYDAEITLLQTVRGKEAWQRIQAANAAAEAPKPGFDYVLAKVSFLHKARIAPGNKTFELGTPLQFTAFSADGREYAAPAAKPPAPELTGKARPGTATEGWIVFLIEQKDTKPLMAFDPGSGGGMLRGKVLWFQLY
jgi:hypothetical protein